MGPGRRGCRTALLTVCFTLVVSCGSDDTGTRTSDPGPGSAESAANLRALEGTRTANQKLAKDLAPAIARALAGRVSFTGTWSDCTPEVYEGEPEPPRRYAYHVVGDLVALTPGSRLPALKKHLESTGWRIDEERADGPSITYVFLSRAEQSLQLVARSSSRLGDGLYPRASAWEEACLPLTGDEQNQVMTWLNAEPEPIIDTGPAR